MNFLVIKNLLLNLLYSTAVTFGIYIAIFELHRYGNLSQFLFFTVAIFLILILEVIINYREKSNKVELNLNFRDGVNELAHLTNKIFLPIALYLSFIAFGYFNFNNDNSVLISFVLFITFIAFFILFTNIRAFFQNQHNLEVKTSYVYDIFKFIIFFNAVNSISHYINLYPNYSFFYICILLFLTLALILLMLWRANHLHLKSKIYSIIIAGLVLIFFVSLNFFFELNELQISMASLFVFYLGAAIIHHDLNKTLNRDVVIEYLVMLFIAVAILLGVN